MKFGQRLVAEAIPEWRVKYLDYDSLKRHLKTIPHVPREAYYSNSSEDILHASVNDGVCLTDLPKQQPKFSSSSANDAVTITVETASPDQAPWLNPNLPLPERLFFEKLASEVDKMDAFYRQREEEVIQTNLYLIHQVKHLTHQHRTRSRKRAEEKRRSLLSDILSKLPSSINTMPAMSWPSQWRKDAVPTVAHARLEENNKTPSKTLNAMNMFMSESSSDQVGQSGSSSSPLHASSTAPLGRVREEVKTTATLTKSSTPTSPSSQSPSSHRRSASAIVSPTLGVSFSPTSKFAKSAANLEKAILEFYRLLLLIWNYQKLNLTGCMKILKKYDKITNKNVKQLYMKSVEDRKIFASRVVEAVIQETEVVIIVVAVLFSFLNLFLFGSLLLFACFDHHKHLYSHHFAKGNRHEAMEKLRLPEVERKSFHRSAFLAGGCSGVSLAFIVLLIYYASLYPEMIHEPLLLVYASLFLPLLMAWLLGINFAIWEIFRIHYQFIFEWDLRHFLSVPQYVELISWIGLLFIVFAFFSSVKALDAVIAFEWQPIVLLCSLLALILMPFPVFFYSTRQWFVRVLWRILVLFRYRVRFKDFFIADLFISLTYFFRSPVFIYWLFYASHPDQPASIETEMETIPLPSSSWVTYLLMILPSFIRACQCYRRYWDSGMKHPHLLNLAKYLITASTNVFACGYSFFAWSQLFPIWVVSLCLTTLFSLYWDVVMDWGFVRHDKYHIVLRNHMVYPSIWIYYFALVSNIILRFLWIFNLTGWTQSHHWSVSYSIAVAEVYRRIQWVLFRVEHEHLNNCGEFRATHVLSLPFESDLFFTPGLSGPPQRTEGAPLSSRDVEQGPSKTTLDDFSRKRSMESLGKEWRDKDGSGTDLGSSIRGKSPMSRMGSTLVSRENSISLLQLSPFLSSSSTLTTLSQQSVSSYCSSEISSSSLMSSTSSVSLPSLGPDQSNV